MNNLKKLGLTALAGSLVAVSAQAGELAVSGSAAIAYKHQSNKVGYGLGTNKAWGLSGSGELDNGWSVALATNLTDANALSSSTTALTMGSLGTITIGQGHGGNSGGYDEEVPQAYEQVSDAGTDTAANYVGSWLGNGAVGWALPSIDTGAGTLSLKVGYAANADNIAVSDGGASTHAGDWGQGYDVGATLVTDMGLTVGAYGAKRANEAHVPSGSAAISDEFNGTWFVKYNAGPVSIGYQSSYVDTGNASGTVTATTTAKAIGTSHGAFEDTQISILFNVNDNLSVSWTDATSTYDDGSNVKGGTEIADVDMNLDAMQIAYSMGGMSINAYMMSAENIGWDTDATDVDTTEISIGLAF